MKKYLILILLVGVCWLSFAYHKQQQMVRGEELVAGAYNGDLVAVKNAVEQGAPLGFVVEFDDEENGYVGQRFNALHAAASSGNEPVVKYLLQEGLDINTQTPQGWTPLFVSARDGQAGVAKLLISRGADLNLQTNLGATALMMAATQPFEKQKDRLDLVEYMLRRGADTNLTDKYGHTALYYAQKHGSEAVVKLLEQSAAAGN